MATVNRYSAQHPTTLSGNTPGIYNARLHVMYDQYTFTAEEGAADTIEIDFPRLLPGKVVIFPQLSWVRADDADANGDLHLGYRAYRDSAGDTQVADDNYWLDNVDVGGGDKQGLIPAITGVTTAGARPLVFDAQDGLRIFMTLDTGNANVGDIYSVCIVYAHID